ncbi:MAG: DUF692 domain-containing protein [Rhodospirillales bacterium]
MSARFKQLTDAPLTGIGLKPIHAAPLLADRPALGFVEVHAENYLTAEGFPGGPTWPGLRAVADHYPLSLHGVGLSLGTASGLDRGHLAALCRLVEATRPLLVSDHLAFSVVDGVYLNDLLPLPLNTEALDVLSRNIEHAQKALGRRLLVENPSSYLQLKASTLSEPAFLARLVDRTGCGLLLDVNNVYVSARNAGEDPLAWLLAMPLAAVGEVHLAGHAVRTINGVEIHIDDHGSAVSQAVWDLYARLIQVTGPLPTLIEWDNDVPELSVLLGEADRARAVMKHATEGRRHVA